MKKYAIIIFFLVSNFNLLLADQSLPIEREIDYETTNILLNMEIIGSENLGAKVFYYDIVGLQSDATATYLTNGVTKDIAFLTTELKLNRNFVKVGIKLKWGKKSRYFLFDRDELSGGKIEMEKGKD